MKGKGIYFASHYIGKPSSTVVLLVVVSILLNVLFFTSYELFSNEFFRYYPYVIAIIGLLIFVSAFVVKERSMRIGLIMAVVVAILYLVIFVLFSFWLGGLAKAFSNG